MLRSVTRAPILFFDSNPLGRIINRFSKDTAVSDGTLPEQAYIFSGVSHSSPLGLLAVCHVRFHGSHHLPLPSLDLDCGASCNVPCAIEILGCYDGLASL